MCILCIEYQKEKMTNKELYSAATELAYTVKTKEEMDHIQELLQRALHEYFKDFSDFKL